MGQSSEKDLPSATYQTWTFLAGPEAKGKRSSKTKRKWGSGSQKENRRSIKGLAEQQGLGELWSHDQTRDQMVCVLNSQFLVLIYIDESFFKLCDESRKWCQVAPSSAIGPVDSLLRAMECGGEGDNGKPKMWNGEIREANRRVKTHEVSQSKHEIWGQGENGCILCLLPKFPQVSAETKYLFCSPSESIVRHFSCHVTGPQKAFFII